MNTPSRFFLLAGLLWLRSITPSMAQGNDNPTGVTGDFNGSVTTGCYYDPLTANAKRVVNDITVPGCVGEYPLKWTRTYNSRSSPAGAGFGQGGPWKHSYFWIFDGALNFTTPDGRVLPFTNVVGDETGDFGADIPGIPEILEVVTVSTYNRFNDEFNLLLPDGGKVCFRRVTYTIGGLQHTSTMVTKLVDPYGLETNFIFNTDGSIWKIVEPGGRYLQITYNSNGYIGTVAAYDGRGNVTQSVNYTYSGTGASTVLARVDYSDGTSATYTYSTAADQHLRCLKSCDDVRYSGPMGKIYYEYNSVYPNDARGTLKRERYSATGAIVSTLTYPSENVRVETRGDGPTRTFNYTPNPTGKDLTSYTSFKAQTSTLSWDAHGYRSGLTDARGNTTNVENTVLGRPTQTQFPLTPNDTPAGTPRGTVSSVFGGPYPYYLYSTTDEGGHVTTYTPDVNNRVARIDYPDGAYETFTYNSFGQILTHQLRTGGVETFTYDARGLKLEYRDPDHATGNPTARYAYDAMDRVSDVTDALGSTLGDPAHTTSYTYNQRGQTLTTTKPIDPVDGQRHTITSVYNANGTLASTTDELGHITSFTYDDYKRVRTATTPLRFTGDTTPRITYTYYDANGTGNDYTRTDPNVTYLALPGGEKTVTTYDENRRKTSVTAAYGTTSAAKTSFECDSVGNVTGIISPKEQSGQPYAGQKTVTTYDERNRAYVVTDPLGRATSSTFDAAGRKVSTTRPNGQVVTYDSFDSMNRLLQQTVKQTPDPDAVTRFTYYTAAETGSGLLKTMQDPRSVAANTPSIVYSYVYDSMGRKTSAVYPAAAPNPQTSESWHYDTLGRVDTFTNRNNKTQTTVYDALSRPTSISWNDGLTPTVMYSYDVASRKQSVTNINATVSYAYLNDNLLSTETTTYADSTARTLTYTYNANAKPASLQYPGGVYTFNYNYTPRLQLQTLVNNSGGGTIGTYVYDLNGNLTTRTPDNSTSTSYTYDALDRATHIGHAFAGANTRTFDYGYEPLTNNRKWTKRDSNLGDAFGYDLNDEVIDAKLNIANADSATTGASIVYDANGNQTSFAAFDPTNPKFGSTDSYTTNDLNQYASRTSSTTPAYDATGNTTMALDGSSATYDAQNRVLTVTKVTSTESYKYDGLNRQVSRTIGTGPPVYNLYDGWNLIAEYAPGGTTPTNSYIYGPSGLIKRISGSTSTYYYQDASGSTSHLADSGGNLVEWYRYDLQGTPIGYDAFNNQLSTNNFSARHLFTGQQWYSNVGVYDLRNRFYSPDIGRFLQGDPIGFKGDATNLYRYCGNNPLMRSDPTGEFAYVEQIGNSITILVPMHYGFDRGVNPTLGNTFNKFIGQMWSTDPGQKFGKYTVTTIAYHDRSDPNSNVVRVKSGQSKFNSNEWAQAGVRGPDYLFEAVGHEAGHLMGINVPGASHGNTSDRGNIMTSEDHGNKPTGKDIDMILASPENKPIKERPNDTRPGSGNEPSASGPAAGMSLGDYNWALASGRGIMGYSPAIGAESVNYGGEYGAGPMASGITHPPNTDFAWGNPDPDGSDYPTGPVGSREFGNHSYWWYFGH